MKAEPQEPFGVDFAAGGQRVRLTADSTRLLHEFIPPTSDDLAQLCAAASFSSLATSGTKPGGAAARAAADPYLRRLDELSKGQPAARAATAAFLRGFALMTMKDHGAAAACLRRAARLEPTFDSAWAALLRTECDADYSRRAVRGALLGTACQVDMIHGLGIAREWAAQSGSPYARYKLARALAWVGDWPAAERVIAAELAKYPDDPRLMMARAACWLRSTTTEEDFEIVGREMLAADARLKQSGAATPELMRDLFRLTALCAARYGDIAAGRWYADKYAQWSEGKSEKADVAALRKLLDQLAASPLPALTSSKASRRSFDGAKPGQPGVRTASRKGTPAPERR